jgi:hypothetical protein
VLGIVTSTGWKVGGSGAPEEEIEENERKLNLQDHRHDQWPLLRLF